MVMIFIIAGALLSILMLVSKKNMKKAFLAFLVTQVFTWPLGLLFVALGKIQYPVRLFPKAIDNSFLGGFILNPIVFAIYYIHYPRNIKLKWRCLCTLLIIAIPACIEFAESKFTNLVRYKNWSPFYTWLLGIPIYFIMIKYLDWFFKNISNQGVSKNEI